ncbi:hypothetical protein [Leptothoe sp. PORK10 BA2]|nr:hypothetical protein [Leptothoe sp. PORK10 BA2]MEA5463388.1 hypothetical protein [Leptothoe sp. PORK10 BA2]
MDLNTLEVDLTQGLTVLTENFEGNNTVAKQVARAGGDIRILPWAKQF